MVGVSKIRMSILEIELVLKPLKADDNRVTFLITVMMP